MVTPFCSFLMLIQAIKQLYGIKLALKFYSLKHLMLAYYWYRMLFAGRNSEVYSSIIDKMYGDLFLQFFSHTRAGSL